MTTSIGPRKRPVARPLSILICVAALDVMGALLVLPLIPFYVTKFHASPTFVGAILASFSAVQLVAAPLWGRVSDRYGRRPALLAGLGALTAGYVLFAFADSIWMLFLARVVQGAGGGTTGVVHAYVTDTLPPEDRARGLGWLSAGTNVGTAIGPPLGSLASAWGQFAPGLLAASLCTANLLFAWVGLPESRKPPDGSAAKPQKSVWRGVWSVIAHPKAPVSRLTLVYAAGWLGQAALGSVLGLYLQKKFGFTEGTIGFVYMYVGIFAVVMRSGLVGPIVDRIGEIRAIRIGTLLLAAGLVGYPLAPNLWVLAAIVPLVPIGQALLFPATTSLMSRAAEKTEVGATMGIAQTFAGLSRLVAPVTATALFQYATSPAPFLFAASSVAVAGLLTRNLGGKSRTADHPVV